MLHSFKTSTKETNISCFRNISAKLPQRGTHEHSTQQEDQGWLNLEVKCHEVEKLVGTARFHCTLATNTNNIPVHNELTKVLSLLIGVQI